MSWAGNLLIGKKIRSLFHQKEQAPSSKRLRSRAVVLSQEEYDFVDGKVAEWVREKSYRLPDPTVELVARRMGVESAQLYRYSQLRFGEDFRSWRTRLRIQDAQEQLLAEPGTSASTIGRRVGFNDRSNFNRHFREITGYSPAQWRSLPR
ncbi:MAG: AraC family transcriptional regulator [Bacteroidales bacterium]|nr:AraC family transcriptional regulator [Bacteroidales bacterium]